MVAEDEPFPPAKGYRPRCFFDIQINKVSGRCFLFKVTVYTRQVFSPSSYWPDIIFRSLVEDLEMNKVKK